MHLLDTPGVLPPKIESVETGLKLALCGEQNRIFSFRKHLMETLFYCIQWNWSHIFLSKRFFQCTQLIF